MKKSNKSTYNDTETIYYDLQSGVVHHYNVRAFKQPRVVRLNPLLQADKRQIKKNHKLFDAIIEEFDYTEDGRRVKHVYHCSHDQDGNKINIELHQAPEPLVVPSDPINSQESQHIVSNSRHSQAEINKKKSISRFSDIVSNKNDNRVHNDHISHDNDAVNTTRRNNKQSNSNRISNNQNSMKSRLYHEDRSSYPYYGNHGDPPPSSSVPTGNPNDSRHSYQRDPPISKDKYSPNNTVESLTNHKKSHISQPPPSMPSSNQRQQQLCQQHEQTTPNLDQSTQFSRNQLEKQQNYIPPPYETEFQTAQRMASSSSSAGRPSSPPSRLNNDSSTRNEILIHQTYQDTNPMHVYSQTTDHRDNYHTSQPQTQPSRPNYRSQQQEQQSLLRHNESTHGRSHIDHNNTTYVDDDISLRLDSLPPVGGQYTQGRYISSSMYAEYQNYPGGHGQGHSSSHLPQPSSHQTPTNPSLSRAGAAVGINERVLHRHSIHLQRSFQSDSCPSHLSSDDGGQAYHTTTQPYNPSHLSNTATSACTYHSIGSHPCAIPSACSQYMSPMQVSHQAKSYQCNHHETCKHKTPIPNCLCGDNNIATNNNQCSCYQHQHSTAHQPHLSQCCRSSTQTPHTVSQMTTSCCSNSIGTKSCPSHHHHHIPNVAGSQHGCQFCNLTHHQPHGCSCSIIPQHNDRIRHEPQCSSYNTLSSSSPSHPNVPVLPPAYNNINNLHHHPLSIHNDTHHHPQSQSQSHIQQPPVKQLLERFDANGTYYPSNTSHHPTLSSGMVGLPPFSNIASRASNQSSSGIKAVSHHNQNQGSVNSQDYSNKNAYEHTYHQGYRNQEHLISLDQELPSNRYIPQSNQNRSRYNNNEQHSDMYRYEADRANCSDIRPDPGNHRNKPSQVVHNNNATVLSQVSHNNNATVPLDTAKRAVPFNILSHRPAPVPLEKKAHIQPSGGSIHGITIQGAPMTQTRLGETMVPWDQYTQPNVARYNNLPNRDNTRSHNEQYIDHDRCHSGQYGDNDRNMNPQYEYNEYNDDDRDTNKMYPNNSVDTKKLEIKSYSEVPSVYHQHDNQPYRSHHDHPREDARRSGSYQHQTIQENNHMHEDGYHNTDEPHTRYNPSNSHQNVSRISGEEHPSMVPLQSHPSHDNNDITYQSSYQETDLPSDMHNTRYSDKNKSTYHKTYKKGDNEQHSHKYDTSRSSVSVQYQPLSDAYRNHSQNNSNERYNEQDHHIESYHRVDPSYNGSFTSSKDHLEREFESDTPCYQNGEAKSGRSVFDAKGTQLNGYYIKEESIKISSSSLHQCNSNCTHQPSTLNVPPSQDFDNHDVDHHIRNNNHRSEHIPVNNINNNSQYNNINSNTSHHTTSSIHTQYSQNQSEDTKVDIGRSNKSDYSHHIGIAHNNANHPSHSNIHSSNHLDHNNTAMREPQQNFEDNIAPYRVNARVEYNNSQNAPESIDIGQDQSQQTKMAKQHEAKKNQILAHKTFYASFSASPQSIQAPSSPSHIESIPLPSAHLLVSSSSDSSTTSRYSQSSTVSDKSQSRNALHTDDINTQSHSSQIHFSEALNKLNQGSSSNVIYSHNDSQSVYSPDLSYHHHMPSTPVSRASPEIVQEEVKGLGIGAQASLFALFQDNDILQATQLADPEQKSRPATDTSSPVQHSTSIKQNRDPATPTPAQVSNIFKVPQFNRPMHTPFPVASPLEQEEIESPSERSSSHTPPNSNEAQLTIQNHILHNKTNLPEATQANILPLFSPPFAASRECIPSSRAIQGANTSRPRINRTSNHSIPHTKEQTFPRGSSDRSSHHNHSPQITVSSSTSMSSASSDSSTSPSNIRVEDSQTSQLKKQPGTQNTTTKPMNTSKSHFNDPLTTSRSLPSNNSQSYRGLQSNTTNTIHNNVAPSSSSTSSSSSSSSSSHLSSIVGTSPNTRRHLPGRGRFMSPASLSRGSMHSPLTSFPSQTLLRGHGKRHHHHPSSTSQSSSNSNIKGHKSSSSHSEYCNSGGDNDDDDDDDCIDDDIHVLFNSKNEWEYDPYCRCETCNKEYDMYAASVALQARSSSSQKSQSMSQSPSTHHWSSSISSSMSPDSFNNKMKNDDNKSIDHHIQTIHTKWIRYSCVSSDNNANNNNNGEDNSDLRWEYDSLCRCEDCDAAYDAYCAEVNGTSSITGITYNNMHNTSDNTNYNNESGYNSGTRDGLYDNTNIYQSDSIYDENHSNRSSSHVQQQDIDPIDYIPDSIHIQQFDVHQKRNTGTIHDVMPSHDISLNTSISSLNTNGSLVPNHTTTLTKGTSLNIPVGSLFAQFTDSSSDGSHGSTDNDSLTNDSAKNDANNNHPQNLNHHSKLFNTSNNQSQIISNTQNSSNKPTTTILSPLKPLKPFVPQPLKPLQPLPLKPLPKPLPVLPVPKPLQQYSPSISHNSSHNSAQSPTAISPIIQSSNHASHQPSNASPLPPQSNQPLNTHQLPNSNQSSLKRIPGMMPTAMVAAINPMNPIPVSTIQPANVAHQTSQAVNIPQPTPQLPPQNRQQPAQFSNIPHIPQRNQTNIHQKQPQQTKYLTDLGISPQHGEREYSTLVNHFAQCEDRLNRGRGRRAHDLFNSTPSYLRQSSPSVQFDIGTGDESDALWSEPPSGRQLHHPLPRVSLDTPLSTSILLAQDENPHIHIQDNYNTGFLLTPVGQDAWRDQPKCNKSSHSNNNKNNKVSLYSDSSDDGF